MQIHALKHHQNFSPEKVSQVSVRWTELNDGRLMLRYAISDCKSLVLPDFRGKGRGDDLWKMTCGELFLYDGEGCYREYNFSPSQQWSAYEFSGYRMGRRDIDPIDPPQIIAERGQSIFMLTVFLSQKELRGATRGAVCAVVEENGGRPSYWAMSHHKLEPDFHDPACFGLHLAPPE
ncbi:MAG: DOMON-like domain-containing protein [Novosphingobium sp.]|nr:DOMON-like domain-containing protein [Novosphingobium sp.]